MRKDDLLVETALKEIAGILAAAYQRYRKVVRIAPTESEKELDNSADSSTHVVDARRTRR
jgi:alpha-ketoglutarate-dependent taurine dioxygenase